MFASGQWGDPSHEMWTVYLWKHTFLFTIVLTSHFMWRKPVPITLYVKLIVITFYVNKETVGFDFFLLLLILLSLSFCS